MVVGLGRIFGFGVQGEPDGLVPHPAYGVTLGGFPCIRGLRRQVRRMTMARHFERRFWLAGLAGWLLGCMATTLEAEANGRQLTAEVQVFAGCELVSAPWADGDSFPVRLPDGGEMTVRLYEVDCPEDKVGGDADARRVREQRRHFGLETNQQAIEFGEAATRRARELLEQPFTVRTHFADGRGDPRYPRFYAWVELSDGRDLGEVLVSEGLARAHGVYRGRPDGSHQDEARDRVAALEMAAAVRGRGAWAKTNWDRLPQDRQDARRELVEMEELTGGGGMKPGDVVNINTASRDELMRLPRIGEALAHRIIEARLYESVEDLRRVNGIGAATLEALREWITVDPE